MKQEQADYLEIVTKPNTKIVLSPEEWDDFQYDGRALVILKDGKINAVYNFAKIFSIRRVSEQEQIEEYQKSVPAYDEVLDILNRAKTETGFQWANITVTQFRELFPAALRQYTTKQIGQALNACGVEKKQIRINGEPTRCRRLPIPCCCSQQTTQEGGTPE